MTSRQKLKAIVIYCWMRGGCDYTKEQIETFYNGIEKDLNVLELLKSNCYNKEKHIRHMSDTRGEPFLLISFSIEGKENIEEIEEWYYDK